MTGRVFDLNNAEFEPIVRDILASGRSVRFRARGNSMRPFIYDGDILEMRPIQESSLRVGEVVMFADRRGGLLVHRIIRFQGHSADHTLQTQGDANRTADGEISIDQVLARLTQIERNGKILRQDTLTQRALGRIWVALAPVIKRIYYSLRYL